MEPHTKKVSGNSEIQLSVCLHSVLSLLTEKQIKKSRKKWFSQEHGYKNQLNEKIVKTMLSKYAIRVSTVGMRGLSNSAFASNPNYRTNLNVFNKKLCFINGGGVLIPKLQELRQMSSLADEIIKNKKQAQWIKMNNAIWKIIYVKARGPGIELLTFHTKNFNFSNDKMDNMIFFSYPNFQFTATSMASK